MDSLLGTLARATGDVVRVVRATNVVRALLAFLVVTLLPALAYASDVRIGTYADLPLRKSGLWEVTVPAHVPSGSGGRMQPAMTLLQCTDANAERMLPFFVLPARETCSRITVSANGKVGHDVSTVCASHGQRMDMQMTVRGDMQLRYDGSYRIHYPSGPSGSTARVPFQGRWLGRCKPDQRAGDMVLPNGITVNTVDDARRASGHAH